MALLDVAGNETGVQILGAGLGDDATTRSLAFEKGMKTISPGAIQLGRVAITIEGKEPAGGRPLFDDGYSVVFADTGRTVPGVTGEGAKGAPASNTLFLPLDSVGQMQVPPNGVLGVVRTRQGWYYARQAAGGGVLYQYIGVGTLPDLAAKPVGQQYSALHSYGIVDIGRTPKGWGRAAGSSLGTTYPDMTIAAAKIDAEVREKLRVDTAVLVARNKAQEEARLAEERLEQGLRRNDLLAQLDRASREKWPEGSLGLKFLQDRIVNYGLEEEYRRAGLPMSRVEDEACRRGRSSYCSAAINRSASSGSSFEWTWQKSFDDASAASKRRNTENCAAALKGAARMCTMP
ncbi:MAG: hypothetical protein EON59_13445 [Alphaproteobacteria bacterium]|nr:MAG: hypothetical protein EON59_13445 [Alphaproteobacteria bacterium]